jgi:hypothetical protein
LRLALVGNVWNGARIAAPFVIGLTVELSRGQIA